MGPTSNFKEFDALKRERERRRKFELMQQLKRQISKTIKHSSGNHDSIDYSQVGSFSPTSSPIKMSYDANPRQSVKSNEKTRENKGKRDSIPNRAALRDDPGSLVNST